MGRAAYPWAALVNGASGDGASPVYTKDFASRWWLIH